MEQEKFIGVKLVTAVLISAEEAKNGYNAIFDTDDTYSANTLGYMTLFPNGSYYWRSKERFCKHYFKLSDYNADNLTVEDVDNFIAYIDNSKVGTKTTNTTITCITGFEVNGQASCVKAEDFNIDFGAKIALPKAKDALWAGLGFVLQWAKYGLHKTKQDKIPPHIKRMIDEYRELFDKCTKLIAFIAENSIYNNLPSEDKNLMLNQYDAMTDYLEVLKRRLEKAGVNVKAI